ncbi:DUF3426 domain-containing protein [Thioclava electrotropha]|uniref:DUF3426 domain-containing protein n=1 Tax=Thioclava electrotropha TaxID=1549850 RepID=UPI0034DE72CC
MDVLPRELEAAECDKEYAAHRYAALRRRRSLLLSRRQQRPTRREDLEGRAVAARTLAPDQYLAANTPRHLQGRQSLHLALELRDPGPEAVSYRIVSLE